MKSRKERKITKAFANIERNNKQIAKLEKSYQQLVETFGIKHPGVKVALIKLEYMRNILNSKNKHEQDIVKLWNV